MKTSLVSDFFFFTRQVHKQMPWNCHLPNPQDFWRIKLYCANPSHRLKPPLANHIPKTKNARQVYSLHFLPLNFFLGERNMKAVYMDWVPTVSCVMYLVAYILYPVLFSQQWVRYFHPLRIKKLWQREGFNL